MTTTTTPTARTAAMAAGRRADTGRRRQRVLKALNDAAATGHEIRSLRPSHRRRGRWRRPSADGIELFNIASVPITRYRYRGAKIPNPWLASNHA